MKRDKFGYGVFALGFVGYLVRRLLYTVGVDSPGASGGRTWPGNCAVGAYRRGGGPLR